MSGRDWYDRFAATGPSYEGQRLSVAELRALLLKAGRGSGLPLGHAQDLAGLASLLMSDPQLLAMAAAAIEGHHHSPVVEGTDAHVVIERVEVLMAAPMLVDMLVAGADRVVLHDMDWPLLLWPYLSNAQAVYGQNFNLATGAKGTVIVTPSERDTLDRFGPPQSVPHQIIERLEAFAAKTYVPASEASRQSGAGAGLTDND